MLVADAAKVFQVFDEAKFPAVRFSQQDRRAYMLTLTSRALRAFKLAGVNVDPITAAQGGRVGKLPPKHR